MNSTQDRAARIYGRALGDPAFQRVLSSLGLTDDPVRVVLATTSVGEFLQWFADVSSYPVIVIDDVRGRVARLDFHAGGVGVAIPVNNSTDFGMLVDYVESRHRDIAAEVLQASIHAQTREFHFA